MVMGKLYFRDTTTETLATGYVDPRWRLDLSDTQGTPATIVSGSFGTSQNQECLRFYQTVGVDGVNGIYQFSLKVSAESGSQDYFRTTIRRFNSAGTDQDNSSTFEDNAPAVGIYTHAIPFSTTWAVDDVLVVQVLASASSMAGFSIWDFDVNDPDSFVIAPDAFAAAVSSPSIHTGLSL
jgi:hypothetical protein